MAISSQKKKAVKTTENREADDAVETGFPELEWERRESPRPSNRQRAILAVAFALLLAWWVALGWLVMDSLS